VKCSVCGIQPFADEGPCACAAGLDRLLVERVRAALGSGIDGDERADVELWLGEQSASVELVDDPLDEHVEPGVRVRAAPDPVGLPH
jgi:hypothetical protein